MRNALLGVVIVGCAAALAAACGGAAPRPGTTPDLASIAWLEGDWIGHGPDGEPAEERWASADDGALVGRALAEQLRVEVREGVIAYVARPAGTAGETVFRAVEIAEGRAVFEAPEHDFPQRIEYVRQGDALTATISDLAGARRLTWTFHREPGRP